MQIRSLATVCGFAAALTMSVFAQTPLTTPPQWPSNDDPIRTLVSRLDLEQVQRRPSKALTQFGDRRQGTKRNRDAVDWIEAQLKSYGCTNV